MKLRLILYTKQWQCCWTQCGSESGWSSWEDTSRGHALYWIERGGSYETLENLK